MINNVIQILECIITKQRKIGVVGDTYGIPKEVVFGILIHVVKKNDMIISGGAIKVDTYAEEFALKYNIAFKKFLPKERVRKYYDYKDCIWKTVHYSTKKDYFKRNKQIADESHCMVCFIMKGKVFGGGTWNTINHFTQDKRKLDLFLIFDEKGRSWEKEEYPQWLKKRLK